MDDVPVKSFNSDRLGVGLIPEFPMVFDLSAELDGSS
jgi:hypothetical protein